MSGTVATTPERGVGAPPARVAGLAVLGSANGRLLAGDARREDVAAHRGRLGPLPSGWDDPAWLLDVVAEAGVRGRGGGYFPLAEKMAVARRSPGRAVVVVNATESEPASAKDRHLMLLRPHLILDGAQAVAAAVGADRVIAAVHRGEPARSLEVAASERGAERVPVSFAPVPDRYVAGESSALVSMINGGPAIPAGRNRPTAECGVDGRPTVVSNAETLCHVALVARRGPRWFREVGPPGAAGSVLVTVTGDVASPGTVLEVVGPATVGQAVAAAGGTTRPAAALLVGGYAGRWQPAPAIWDAPIDPMSLEEAGSPIGCGLLGVLGAGRCGLAEAARLAGWLSEQRAGQCGACDAGLPALAGAATGLAEGTVGARRALRRIAGLGEVITGRSLCNLPDGTVAMVDSALSTFWDEVALHRRRRCSDSAGEAVFALPAPEDRHAL